MNAQNDNIVATNATQLLQNLERQIQQQQLMQSKLLAQSGAQNYLPQSQQSTTPHSADAQHQPGAVHLGMNPLASLDANTKALWNSLTGTLNQVLVSDRKQQEPLISIPNTAAASTTSATINNPLDFAATSTNMVPSIISSAVCNNHVTSMQAPQQQGLRPQQHVRPVGPSTLPHQMSATVPCLGGAGASLNQLNNVAGAGGTTGTTSSSKVEPSQTQMGGQNMYSSQTRSATEPFDITCGVLPFQSSATSSSLQELLLPSTNSFGDTSLRSSRGSLLSIGDGSATNHLMRNTTPDQARVVDLVGATSFAKLQQLQKETQQLQLQLQQLAAQQLQHSKQATASTLLPRFSDNSTTRNNGAQTNYHPQLQQQNSTRPENSPLQLAQHFSSSASTAYSPMGGGKNYYTSRRMNDNSSPVVFKGKYPRHKGGQKMHLTGENNGCYRDIKGGPSTGKTWTTHNSSSTGSTTAGEMMSNTSSALSWNHSNRSSANCNSAGSFSRSHVGRPRAAPLFVGGHGHHGRHDQGPVVVAAASSFVKTTNLSSDDVGGDERKAWDHDQDNVKQPQHHQGAEEELQLSASSPPTLKAEEEAIFAKYSLICGGRSGFFFLLRKAKRELRSSSVTDNAGVGDQTTTTALDEKVSSNGVANETASTPMKTLTATFEDCFRLKIRHWLRKGRKLPSDMLFVFNKLEKKAKQLAKQQKRAAASSSSSPTELPAGGLLPLQQGPES